MCVRGSQASAPAGLLLGGGPSSLGAEGAEGFWELSQAQAQLPLPMCGHTLGPSPYSLL